MADEVKHFHTETPQPAGDPPMDYPIRPIFAGPSGSLNTWQAEFDPGHSPVERPINPHDHDLHLIILEGVGKIRQDGKSVSVIFYPGCTVCLERSKRHFLVNTGNCPVKLISVMYMP